MNDNIHGGSVGFLGSFFTFLRFEFSFWLKGFMIWIFVAVLTFIMATILLAEESILEDVFFGNSFRNSSFVIHRCYAMAAVFGCLMVTAFVNSAASREFSCDTAQLIFTKPINKYGYLLGRFFGSMVVALIPMLGVSFAVLGSQWISTTVPQLESLSGKWGAIDVGAHLSGVFVFAIPNTFLISAVVFAIAVWTRSALASFVGILGFIVAISISGALVGALSNEYWAAMAEPFGDTAMATMTKYWTISDKNTKAIPFSGLLMWNRLIWVSFGCVFLSIASWRFSFSTGTHWLSRIFTAVKASVQDTFLGQAPTQEFPVVDRRFGWVAQLRKLLRLTRAELWSTVKSPVFICLMIGVFLMVSISLSTESEQGFGLSALPVTFSIVSLIDEALGAFQIVLVTFFAGVFVWKERDAKLDEIFDALPFPSWIAYLSKFFALVAIVVSVMMFGLLCGVFYQATSGYFNFQLGVYFQELLLIGLAEMLCLIVLAMLCHVLSPNKYIGYFSFIGFLVFSGLIWSWLGVETLMVQFGTLPSYIYSDMFGLQPYARSIFWFMSYWLLLSAVLAMLSVLVWQRGRERSWSMRLGQVWTRSKGGLRWALLLTVLMWLGTGGFVYWNTLLVNPFKTTNEQRAEQADYEHKFKELASQAQPRIVKIRYDIDLFPERRRLEMRGKQTIKNCDDEAISRIYITAMDPFDTEVQIENAKVESVDEQNKFYTFVLDEPMEPGETCEMRFELTYEPKGFENSLSVPQIVQNGTFFNNFIAPQIGYFASAELTDRRIRKIHGLGTSSQVPLDSGNLAARRNHYLTNSSDWVDVETVISTSSDQVAVAPGALKEKWQAKGRNFFRYQLDHPSLNFYSFVSARYKVASRKWKDVDIEVYYHPEHEWNVDLMLKSIRKSLEYYTEAFGPYRHKQARIIEFPRVASFAQAFPGTMPYSEGVGFIADLKSDNDIDMVFYVVAHEMAHQWWAHQVIGAKMQGATLLSETLAQYSSLMVMEKEYGREMMRKFLKYELDNYLRARGSEKGKEFPLREVEAGQGYIHYNKGSVVMYHLRETIGEEKLNQALRSLVDRFAYQGPPYPTSLDLIEAIREFTPEEHQGLVDDLFEKITLFDNRTVSTHYSETEDGKFNVTIEAEFKKMYAEPNGKEVETDLDDWIEIGAFARPSRGSEFGKSLFRKKVRIDQMKHTFEFVVDEEPYRAGVDPFSLLIDRNTLDNMKEPKKLN